MPEHHGRRLVEPVTLAQAARPVRLAAEGPDRRTPGGRMALRFGAPVTLLAILTALMLPATALAASSQSPRTFAEVVAGMQLIVVADVDGSPEAGVTYTVETVLKGSGPPELQFAAPDLQSAVQPGWTRVVIAFSNPTTDDFRAPTIAWHVAADGAIDPEGYQQYVGLPGTLPAMLSFFGLPSSTGPSAPPTASTGPSPTPAVTVAPAAAADVPSSWLPVALPILVAGAIAVLAGILVRRRSHDR